MAVAEKGGRQVRYKVVDIPDDRKALPALGKACSPSTEQNARAAEAEAREGMAEIGALVPRVFVRQDGNGGTVGIADHGDGAQGFVGEGGGHLALGYAPRTQKAAVSIENGAAMPPIGGGRKIEILLPVGGAVRGLEIERECAPPTLGGDVNAIGKAGIGSRQALRKQIRKSHTIRVCVRSKFGSAP